MIVFQNVSKQFGDEYAIRNINLIIQPGEFVFLLGPSGAGKTTLARLMIKEIEPSEGEIQIGEFELSRMRGREIPTLRRQIGVVFQDFKLIPDRTAAENIALSLEIMGKPNRIIQATVNELLKATGLDDKGHLFPSQLSGGETQRVVIARAMATEPAVLFADEPTGNLDDETGWQIVELLKRINEAGTAVIMSTHNNSFVKKLKSRTITLKDNTIFYDTDPVKLEEESDQEYETESKHEDNQSTDQDKNQHKAKSKKPKSSTKKSKSTNDKDNKE